MSTLLKKAKQQLLKCKKGKIGYCIGIHKIISLWDGFLAVIAIHYDHSLTTRTMAAFSSLRSESGTRKTFFDYFDAGLNIKNAMQKH